MTDEIAERVGVLIGGPADGRTFAILGRMDDPCPPVVTVPMPASTWEPMMLAPDGDRLTAYRPVQYVEWPLVGFPEATRVHAYIHRDLAEALGWGSSPAPPADATQAP